MAKSIGKRLLEMLNGQIMTDVTFVVQGTEIKGHRVVVSSYGGPLRELLETKEKQVKISKGISPDTFKAVLLYLYTDECTIGNANVFELLYAAMFFQLQDLMDRCVQILTSNLTIKNIAVHTAQALHFDVKAYLRICKDYFRTYAMAILNTREFLEASNEALLELVRTNEIQCSDLELFATCLEWAENDCKRKNLEPNAVNSRICLGDILSQINFANMARDDFLSVVVPTDVLSTEEVGKVIEDWQKLPTRLDAKAVKEKTKQQMSTKLQEGAHTKKVEHQSKKQHPVPNVSQIVQVTVEININSWDPDVVTLALPLSTRISQVKEMKIFKGGKRQCPSDKFTLEQKGKELADDTTLASIYSLGEDFTLKLHSLSFTVRKENGAWEFPLTFTLEEYLSRFVEIIKENVQRLKGIHPDRVKVLKPWAYPGDRILIHLR